MSFPMEDFERIPEMDKMWLLEKDHEMFVEWQQWEEEQAELNRQPAEIVVFTPIPKADEVESDEFPF